MSKFYDKERNQITMQEFGRLFEDNEYRWIAQTDIGSAHVSTVWLGIDHNFSNFGDPLIFETMIFDSQHESINESQWRCSTVAEALAQHEAAVAIARVHNEAFQ